MPSPRNHIRGELLYLSGIVTLVIGEPTVHLEVRVLARRLKAFTCSPVSPVHDKPEVFAHELADSLRRFAIALGVQDKAVRLPGSHLKERGLELELEWGHRVKDKDGLKRLAQ